MTINPISTTQDNPHPPLPGPTGSVWPCASCGAKNWQEAGNLCKAEAVCAADAERQIQYEKFIASMAPLCRCENGPCDGVLAGGLCDSPNERVERREAAAATQ
jgi:hypothetical protein